MNGIQFFQWGLGKQVPFRLRGAEVVDRLTLSDPNASVTAVSKDSYEIVTFNILFMKFLYGIFRIKSKELHLQIVIICYM